MSTTSLSEFAIIDRYFKSPPTSPEKNVIVGIGDDGAVLRVPTGQQLVVSTDTLVSGIHFFPETPPGDIAYKSLAVNLSDLAAMGATPAWFTLALTLPQAEHDWLNAFSKDLLALAQQANIALVGGDTTRGPLSITIQVMGLVPCQQSLLRNGAQVGDTIYVTGTLGDAGLALHEYQQHHLSQSLDAEFLWQRLMRPEPRLQVGTALRGIASSCIDISDGLIADLQHILTASKVGAMLDVNQLPFSKALQRIDSAKAFELALTAGDDYELCFTLPSANTPLLAERLASIHTRVTAIGHITEQLGFWDRSGKVLSVPKQGWQHFE